MLDDILAYIEGAHPVVYFGLLMCAGFGLPVSEDALAIWAGGLIGRGQNPFPAEQYVIALYFGACFSDFVTFGLGRLTKAKLGDRLQRVLFKDPTKIEKAMGTIRKYGNKAGFVQRLSVGARLPISFFSGYSGISAPKFFLGTFLGACVSLPVQLGVGYAMRNQIAMALQFLEDYGGFVAAGILTLVGVTVYRKLTADQDDEGEASSDVSQDGTMTSEVQVDDTKS